MGKDASIGSNDQKSPRGFSGDAWKVLHKTTRENAADGVNERHFRVGDIHGT